MKESKKKKKKKREQIEDDYGWKQEKRNILILTQLLDNYVPMYIRSHQKQ